MKKIIYFSILYSFFSLSVFAQKIDLSGKWNVTINSERHMIELPGSLSENGIGTPAKDSLTNMLTEGFSFVGKASYEREIVIPESYKNKPVELWMERTKVSEVFINDAFAGMQKSVSTPHVYNIGNLLKPGKNKIKIMVDNTKNRLPLGGSHAYSEHTQTNWNGILGDFYLRQIPEVSLNNIFINTEKNGICNIFFVLNASDYRKVNIQVLITDAKGKTVSKIKNDFHIQNNSTIKQQLQLKIPDPQLWDEHNHYLYTLKIEIPGMDSKEIKFGIRDFQVRGKHLSNNNRIVFLRGKHEGGVFPLTGYPSMKKEDWKRNMSIAQSYGINHYRFHSWTPPRAAFEAADELGVFLQPELPLWGKYTATDTVLFNYMMTEGERIMQTFGNHPSFVMFTLGNELEGDTSLMVKVVNQLRAMDDRHLYALGSNNFYWDPQTHPTEDFFVAMRNGKAQTDMSTDLRASFSFADSDGGGIINCLKPNSERNFSKAIHSLNKPVIGHETGQDQIVPDFKEIEAEKGVLQARNFSVFKRRLECAGMIDQAERFLKSSGALTALCYKEEIEMALRTPNFGGFQLLDLQDYPGQGTALVGILNAFMNPKNVISLDKWKEFCNDVVPLARFKKYCWKNNEDFTGQIEIAHYGATSFSPAEIVCTLQDQSGTTIISKTFSSQEIVQGKINLVGNFDCPLKRFLQPEMLTLTVSISHTSYKNSWNIWVYPSYYKREIKEGAFGSVSITRDKSVFEKIKIEGNKRLLYIPKHEDFDSLSVGGLFITDFWNYGMFHGIAKSVKKEPSPGTMGILTDPSHPLFDSFPTDFHTNWQWWNIIKNSRPMILDEMPEKYLPIVQVVDNFDRNHKLGLIYELPVTNGKILVCASDLFACSEEPEVLALWNSMMDYLSENK